MSSFKIDCYAVKKDTIQFFQGTKEAACGFDLTKAEELEITRRWDSALGLMRAPERTTWHMLSRPL